MADRYIDDGRRGQQLLVQGDVVAAHRVFEAMLGRLGPQQPFERAVVLGRIGSCLHRLGQPLQAIARLNQAIALAGAIRGAVAAAASAAELRMTLQSELGLALRASGDFEAARQAHAAALDLAESLHDDGARVVDLWHLGTLAVAENRLGDARPCFEAALALCSGADQIATAGRLHRQLGAVCAALGQHACGARHDRDAARLLAQSGDASGAAECSLRLAEWELAQPGRLNQAHTLASHALALAQAVDPLASMVWRAHGLLAAIVERQAGALADSDPVQAARLLEQGRAGRELQQQAPRIIAALAALPASPADDFGRVALLGRLAFCLDISGRPELALELLQQAAELGASLADSDHAIGLLGQLHTGHARLLRRAGRDAAACRAHEAAIGCAKRMGDLRMQAVNLGELGDVAAVQAQADTARQHWAAALLLFERLEDAAMSAALVQRLGHPDRDMAGREPARDDYTGVRLRDRVAIDYVFQPDLLLDGPRLEKVTAAPAVVADIDKAARPMLRLGTRLAVGPSGELRFWLPAGEPEIERLPGCVVMRRVEREVSLCGAAALWWRLAPMLDGALTAAEILAAALPADRPAVARLIATLAAVDVLDVTARPVGRYLHTATKKGVLAGGLLDNTGVLQLATDGAYRHDAAADSIVLSTAARTGSPAGSPAVDPFLAFHALTRRRRSRRDYDGRCVSRGDFDALLHTACGVTGSMQWEGRSLALRAYPSSGALYAVEIYPIVYGVEGLPAGAYRYRPGDHRLEQVSAGFDRERFWSAALPVERQMVSATAAMICLVGHFARHECKYGEGGYRMMVAEAGHISQNLVLAATALELAARPFGGVFDDLVNADLKLDPEREQFLLAVLVGKAGDTGP